MIRPTDIDIVIAYKNAVCCQATARKTRGFPPSFLTVFSPSHLPDDRTVSLISEQISPQLTKQKTKNIKCLN